METCNSGGFFTKEMIFITGMVFFSTFTPENDFLQKF